MNIIRRRYDVILKLTIMLALIGCFFIAGGKDVKAASEITSITRSENDLNCTVVDSIKDSITHVRLTLSNSVTKTFTFTPPASTTLTITNGAKELLAEAAANHNTTDITVTKVEYSTDGSTYTEVSSVTTTDLNIAVAHTEDAAGTYKMDIYPTTADESKCKVGTDSSGAKAAYCYINESVEVKFEAISLQPNKLYIKEWNSTPTIASLEPTTNPVKVTLSASQKIHPTFNKIVTDITLGGTSDRTFLLQSSPTVKEYAVALVAEATGTADQSKNFNNITWSSDGASSSFLVDSSTTDKLMVTPISAGTYHVTATVNKETGTYDVPCTQTFTFVVIDKLTGFTIKGPTTGYKGVTTTDSFSINTKTPAGTQIDAYQWNAYTNSTRTTAASASDISFSSPTASTTTVTANTVGTYYISLEAKDGLTGSDFIKSTNYITFDVTDSKLTKLEFGADTYEVTVGYKVSATVQATPTAALVSDDVNFSLPSETTATIASSSENETTGVATAVVKGVKSGDVTLTAKGKTNTTVTDTAKIKVYASPTDSSAFKYTESTRVLKGALPDKVLVGNTSYDIDKVTGFKIYVMKGSEQLGTITYKDKGTTGESSASDLESIIKDNVSKFSGDTDTIKLRAVALGTYGSSSDIREAKDESGNLLAWESEVKVYRVSVSGTGITGSQTYGLQGQKVSLTATPAAGYTSVKWSNGSTSTVRDDITVSSTTSSNQLKAEGVLGANTATDSASGDGYDDVPKTSESNMPFIFIIFSVFAVIGTGYALYMTLRPARSSGTDDTDDYDNYDE